MDMNFLNDQDAEEEHIMDGEGWDNEKTEQEEGCVICVRSMWCAAVALEDGNSGEDVNSSP
jgi:hypothetical protein